MSSQLTCKKNCQKKPRESLTVTSHMSSSRTAVRASLDRSLRGCRFVVPLLALGRSACYGPASSREAIIQQRAADSAPAKRPPLATESWAWLHARGDCSDAAMPVTQEAKAVAGPTVSPLPSFLAPGALPFGSCTERSPNRPKRFLLSCSACNFRG